jgi:multidrug efflux pump subunit AcrA (membrane-fusion protein)
MSLGEKTMQLNKNIKLVILTIITILTLTACDIFEEAEQAEVGPVVVIDNSVVSATGVLTPETYAYLSVSIPGVVDDVRVHEGQIVTEGEGLIVLADLAQAEAGLAAAEMELESAQQALDHLNEHTDQERADAWLLLLDAKSVYITAEDQWEDLDKDDLEDDIDNAQEDIVEAEEDLEEAQDKFDSYAELDESSGLRTRYEDELEEAQQDYNEKVRARDELIIELETAEAEWRSALAVVEQAQADYDATLDGPNPDKLVLAEARLAMAEAQVEAAQAQVEKITLSAPFAGTVASLDIQPGEYAAPGQPVVVLADLGSMQVETTDLNEIDVVQIEIGDLAVITFDAIPDREFAGTVTEISPKASEGLGVNYIVIIELNEMPENVRWGMTVFVDIEIGN